MYVNIKPINFSFALGDASALSWFQAVDVNAEIWAAVWTMMWFTYIFWPKCLSVQDDVTFSITDEKHAYKETKCKSKFPADTRHIQPWQPESVAVRIHQHCKGIHLTHRLTEIEELRCIRRGDAMHRPTFDVLRGGSCCSRQHPNQEAISEKERWMA